MYCSSVLWPGLRGLDRSLTITSGVLPSTLRIAIAVPPRYWKKSSLSSVANKLLERLCSAILLPLMACLNNSRRWPGSALSSPQ